MATLNIWINFNGNAEEAFGFYQSVFGGEFTKIIRFKDIAGPEMKLSEKDGNAIMRIGLKIGNNMLFANDVPEIMGDVNEKENRSKISISVESLEEADRIFAGLSLGGEVEYPMGESSWGTYYGAFRDKYGIEWMIDCVDKVIS